MVEEGTEGVRIMTVHRAKGLEFPVVMLCDPTAKATRDQPSRHVDPERWLWAEPLAGCAPRELLERARSSSRATRGGGAARLRRGDARARSARGAGGRRRGARGDAGSRRSIPRSIRRRARRARASPRRAARRSAARRSASGPSNARPGKRAAVNAGRLTPRAGRHAVVWWDPKVLALDAQERVGLRQQRILEADESGSAPRRASASTRVAERARGAARRGRARELRGGAGDRARRRARRGSAAPEVRIETVAGARAVAPAGRASARSCTPCSRRSICARTRAEVARVAALQGRIVGASADEVAAASAAVVAALAHPVIARAAASAGAAPRGAGVPPAGRRPPRRGRGRPRVPRGGRGWTVVDFKTDAELGPRRAAYAAQVRLYADAIARATGERAEALLLVV